MSPTDLPSQRPSMDPIARAHRRACLNEATTYPDPTTGYQVMTARYLWDRGFCCASGCRHCPYLPVHSGETARRRPSWREMLAGD